MHQNGVVVLDNGGESDRGYLRNPDLQREIWAHLFSSVLREAFKCMYVLPMGLLIHKDEAKRYLAVGDGDSLRQVLGTEEDGFEQEWIVNLTKAEVLNRYVDAGMNQAGLAEGIVRAVSSCHPHLHPVLYESIILTGGSTLFPRLAHRLEKELRPLVPDDYQVKITPQEDPILGVWRGSVLASSPDLETVCHQG